MVRRAVGVSRPPASLYCVLTKGIGLKELGDSRSDRRWESIRGDACDWALMGVAGSDECESRRDRFRLVVLVTS